MNLFSYVCTHLCIIVIIHVICITCNPQYGYSAYSSKVRNQRRRSNIPTKHPNSHYSRLVSNEFMQRKPRKQNSKDQGRTFGDHHNSGFPHGFHNFPGLHGHGHGHHQGHLGHHGFNQPAYNQYQSPQTANPCYYRSNLGKSNNNNNNNKESARFLWDINLYNVYPGGRPHRSGCDNDLYSDPDIAPVQPQTSSPGLFSNFVSLFSNGGALNPHAGRPPNKRRPIRPYRPSYQSPPSPGRPIGGSNFNNGDNDSSGDVNTGNSDSGDIYDPVFENNNINNNNINSDRPVYENQYEDQNNEGPQLSPGQIVGGIAHTVNGVIQQLSGNGPTQSASFLRRFYNNNMRRRQYYNDYY